MMYTINMKLTPHHIAITVHNMSVSVAWYEKMFGFEVEHTYHKDGIYMVLLKKDTVRIELFHFDHATNELPSYRSELMSDLHTIGTKHIAFLVEDLDASVKELKSKGADFVIEIDTAGFGGKYIFLKDCNGVLIELYSSQ